MSAVPGAVDRSVVTDAPTWIPVLVRALAALALGLTITFLSDHSAAVGLVGFGACALVAGGAVLAGASGGVRPLLRAQGVALLVGGAAALALSWAGPVALTVAVGGTALLAGGLELAAGIRSRGASSQSGDRIAAGVVTLLLAVAVLAVPPGLSQDFQGENGVAGTLTGSVIAVGAIGAWAVIVGVLLAIAAVGLRGRRDRTPARTDAARS